MSNTSEEATALGGPVQSVRILVVDDDAGICDLLETVLRKDGFEVQSLRDSTKAVEAVRVGEFHLCLLDLMMPRQDGLETLRAIRGLDSDLGVIVITGYPSLDTAVQSMQLDALDYLQKPFTVEDLRAVVARAMKKKGLTRAPEEQLHRVIGETIRNLRKERELTLKQMAKRTGLSVSLLSQIERAESSASISSLYKIAVALETRIQDLFGDF
ncbi:MAG: response regulator [Deltaproteobacteria bacterium]|nr:response regulator [Deltaproteobacteria bacterium]